MKKNQIIFMGKKQHARDPRWQFASNLPEAGAQIVDQGHPERPSKLNRHDISADYSSFVLRQTFEPLAHRFPACFCPKEKCR
jgi:hypothetical protein